MRTAKVIILLAIALCVSARVIRRQKKIKALRPCVCSDCSFKQTYGSLSCGCPNLGSTGACGCEGNGCDYTSRYQSIILEEPCGCNNGYGFLSEITCDRIPAIQTFGFDTCPVNLPCQCQIPNCQCQNPILDCRCEVLDARIGCPKIILTAVEPNVRCGCPEVCQRPKCGCQLSEMNLPCCLPTVIPSCGPLAMGGPCCQLSAPNLPCEYQLPGLNCGCQSPCTCQPCSCQLSAPCEYQLPGLNCGCQSSCGCQTCTCQPSCSCGCQLPTPSVPYTYFLPSSEIPYAYQVPALDLPCSCQSPCQLPCSCQVPCGCQLPCSCQMSCGCQEPCGCQIPCAEAPSCSCRYLRKITLPPPFL